MIQCLGRKFHPLHTVSSVFRVFYFVVLRGKNVQKIHRCWWCFFWVNRNSRAPQFIYFGHMGQLFGFCSRAQNKNEFLFQFCSQLLQFGLTCLHFHIVCLWGVLICTYQGLQSLFLFYKPLFPSQLHGFDSVCVDHNFLRSCFRLGCVLTLCV